MIFLDNYCFRCSKYKEDKEGIPTKTSCKIEKQIFEASYDASKFPEKYVYCVNGKRYICTQFKDRSERKQNKKRKVKQIEGQVKFVI